jgi:catechol 2,3-dioxygenase-like lactoylglutathione lyase family enzyme
MFSHVMIGANDIEASKKFYDAVLGTLGVPAAVMDPKGRYFYLTPTNIFALTKPRNGEAATFANGGTIGFTASSPEAVHAWHEAGLANGGTECEDPPGNRDNGMYVAYLRDPSGNKVCAVKR